MPLTAQISSRSARQEERVSAKAEAVCRRGDHREQVEILDISSRGARFRFRTYYKVGAMVWLRLPLLEPLEARIVWVKNDVAGCTFSAPLHPAIFAVLSKALR